MTLFVKIMSVKIELKHCIILNSNRRFSMKKRILVFFALTIFALSVGGCSKINAFLTPQEVQHHEHSGGTATCLKKAKCDTCGEYYGIKAEHDYKEATCTSPNVCTVCRNISGVALGHVFSDATCTAPSQCERCNLVNSAATGHSFEEWQLIKSPTCTENGEQSRACACGEVQTNVLKSTGHSPTDWTVVKDATCTDDGIKTGICTLCGEYEEKTIKACLESYKFCDYFFFCPIFILLRRIKIFISFFCFVAVLPPSVLSFCYVHFFTSFFYLTKQGVCATIYLAVYFGILTHLYTLYAVAAA